MLHDGIYTSGYMTCYVVHYMNNYRMLHDILLGITSDSMRFHAGAPATDAFHGFRDHFMAHEFTKYKRLPSPFPGAVSALPPGKLLGLPVRDRSSVACPHQRKLAREGCRKNAAGQVQVWQTPGSPNILSPSGLSMIWPMRTI